VAEAFVNMTEGSGKKAHAWDRTIGANTVLDEFMLPGEYPLASYTLRFSQISGATSADHLLQIMAGASLNVRVRRVVVKQHAAPAAVSANELQIVRLTTAGTGGTAVTPGKLDTADAASGTTGMTLPTAKGTESTILYTESIWLGTAAIPVRDPFRIDPYVLEGIKPILIPAGTANGIAIKITTGVASLTLSGWVEFVETSFV
jgi:hypothetical protein